MKTLSTVLTANYREPIPLYLILTALHYNLSGSPLVNPCYVKYRQNKKNGRNTTTKTQCVQLQIGLFWWFLYPQFLNHVLRHVSRVIFARCSKIPFCHWLQLSAHCQLIKLSLIGGQC